MTVATAATTTRLSNDHMRLHIAGINIETRRDASRQHVKRKALQYRCAVNSEVPAACAASALRYRRVRFRLATSLRLKPSQHNDSDI